MKPIFTLFLLSTINLSFSQSIVRPYAPELFSPEISGGVCGFSKDGKTIYFVREDTLQDKLFLYQASRAGNKWTNEKLLPFSGMHNDTGGRLSPDGNSFYFTSDRPNGSDRENDAWNIWVSAREGEDWGTPSALKEINNRGSECCPLPMKDGSLIFSADRGKPKEWWMHRWDGHEETDIAPLTYPQGWQWPSVFIESDQLLLFNSMKRPDTRGMDDVYISFLNKGIWSSPQNMGDPVNTAVYEDGAILSPDDKWLIFNRHDTHATPSHVVYTEWKPLVKKLKRAFMTK